MAAADAPRFRHFAGRRVGLESPIPDSVRSALTGMGHQIEELAPGGAGGAQLIIKLDRGYVAASDPRKDGLAIGN